MVSSIDSALSGLAAASQRLNISAQNIANAESTQTQRDGVTTKTPYTPQRLAQSSLSTGGVTTKTEPVNPATIPVYDPKNVAADSSGITQYPNVDTASQLVDAQISRYDAQANITVLKVQDKLFKSTLNIIS